MNTRKKRQKGRKGEREGRWAPLRSFPLSPPLPLPLSPFLLALAAFGASSVAGVDPIASAMELRVGVGRADITPSGPIWLSGYAARKHPSDGVIQKLWAKAIVIEDDSGGRVVLVTTDLVGLPRELSEDIARRLKAKHGLQRSQIVLNASHTHSGPVVWPNLNAMFFFSPPEKERVLQYAKRLADDIVRAVDAAMADRAAGACIGRARQRRIRHQSPSAGRRWYAARRQPRRAGRSRRSGA